MESISLSTCDLFSPIRTLALLPDLWLELNMFGIVGVFDGVCYFIPREAVVALARLTAIHIHIRSQASWIPLELSSSPDRHREIRYLKSRL